MAAGKKGTKRGFGSVAAVAAAASVHASVHWFIHRVSIRGFKSFGSSAWAEIPLGRSAFLLGLLGANGCGKSNVLDALSFACGCSAANLRVRTLRDVASLDSGPTAPCEVELELRQQGKRQPGSSHVVHAAIAPDGSRVFQVDGTRRTAQQLKEFLRERGVVLDQSISVIRQATVTRLADANSPSQLAEVIADASGLTRWTEETRRATEEIRRTQHALQEIGANIAKLQAAAGRDEQRSRDVARLTELRGDVSRLEAELAAAYKEAASRAATAMAICEADLERAQAEVADKEAAMAALPPLSPGAGGEAGACVVGEGNPACKDIQLQIAVLEQQVAVHGKQLKVAQEAVLDLSRQRGTLSVVQYEVALAEQTAELAAVRVQQLEGLIKASGHSGSSEAEAVSPADLQQLLSEAHTRRAALREELGACELAREAAEQEAEQVAAEAHRMQEDQFALSTGGAAAAAALPRLHHELDAATAAAVAQHGVVADYRARIAALEASLGQLVASQLASPKGSAAAAHDAAASAAAAYGAAAKSARLLHQCFSFREPADVASHQWGVLDMFVKPMSVIAGGSFHVAVCGSTDGAVHLMAAATATGRWNRSSRLRIWPLDRINSPGGAQLLQQQRRAVAQLGSGRAWVPLDLLRYHEQYSPAVLRAFCAHVIAADADAASELLTSFGLSSVTLDGRISKKGSVSGGWDSGGTGGGTLVGLVRAKLECDGLKWCLEQEQRHLAACEGAAVAAAVAVEEAEATCQAVQEWQQAFDAIQQRLDGCAGRRDEARTAAMRAAAAVQEANEAVGRLESLCAAREKGGRAEDTSAWQIAEDLKQARAAASAARSRADEQQLTFERLEADVETAELRCTAALAPLRCDSHNAADDNAMTWTAPSGASETDTEAVAIAAEGAVVASQPRGSAEAMVGIAERRLLLERAQLGELHVQLEQARQKEAEAARTLVKERLARGAVEAQRAALQSDLCDAQARVAELHEEAGRLRVGHAQADQQWRDFERDGASGRLPAQRHSSHDRVSPEIQRLLSALRGRQAECARLESQRGPLADELLAVERVARITLFQQQVGTLRAAAESLEEAVAASRQQALDANEIAFEAVRRRFESLCTSLLPALHCSLTRSTPDGSASDGCLIRFRRRASDPAAAATTRRKGALDKTDGTLANGTVGEPTPKADAPLAEWSVNLEQLSGGQRTLVSLALLLSAARVGGCSSVLLLDEVDAALDEPNQRATAQLLRQLAHHPKHGCQVICVSHNASFQHMCDAVVRLTRSAEGGHTVALVD